MIMKLRDYQERAKQGVQRAWAEGHRAVLLVAPTGSGKTVIAVHSLPSERVLWVAHRRELVLQAKRELESHLGEGTVGVLMAGEPEHPDRRVQVASKDTVLARGAPDYVQVMVLDEAHHVMADTYRDLVSLYPETRVLGMTATPERDDGRPLGDVFDEMVVAASYSELIASGDLVPVDVVRPTERLKETIAMDPVEAWRRYGGGRSAFAFIPSVEEAYRYSDRFLSEARVRADVVEARTPTAWRDEAIQQFGAGRIDVLCSVYALAEGVDVPAAEVAVSSRAFDFVGTMLQCFGRVMRPAQGKERGLVIDLTGATHVHGLPDDDREYSLTSEAPITRADSGGEAEPKERERRAREVSEVQMEVATVGHPPSAALRDLPWAKPKVERASIPHRKLRSIRLKHGRRVMEHAMDYYDRLEG